MNRLALFAAIAVTLQTSSSRADSSTDEAQRVFTQVSPSVVTIHTLDGKGQPEMQGSGVVVGEGLVATNCHVVQEAASIRVRSSQGELPAIWSRQLPSLDLCLLTVAKLTAKPLKLRPSKTLTVGEPVFAVGNPLGFGLAASAGLITMVKAQEPFPLVLATAPVSHGSSGGGLFDSQGQLLGITTAIMGTGQNLNLILVADAAAALLSQGIASTPTKAPPTPEKRWNDIATELQEAGDWARLEKHSQAWSQAQPGAAMPLTFLGMAQKVLKRNEEALATLRQALAQDNNLAFAWLNLADVLRTLGQPEQAELALQQAHNKDPSYSIPSERRAEWLQQQGKPAEALVEVQEALRLNPSRSFTWALLGKIEDDLKHNPEAKRALATALRLGSADDDVKRRLAALSAQAGNNDAPLRQEVSKDGSSSQASYALVAIGRSEIGQGRMGPAEDALRKALALNPRSDDAWNLLGEVLRTSHRRSEADEAFTQAIALLPTAALYLANRAENRRSWEKLELALADAQRATELEPQNVGAWLVSARIQRDRKNYAAASNAFEKAGALKSLTAEQLASWGDSLIGAGNLEAAHAQLQKSEALDAQLPSMCLAMAKLLGTKGDLAGALGYLERALVVNPVDPVAWSSKGYALTKLGKFPQAAEALETAVRLDPALANSWINLGEAQMRNRNLGRAIQALEKAITLAPAAMDARMYLAQSYLSARMTAKSREQTEKLLEQQANFTPGLGLLTMSYLMEGNTEAAAKPYRQLKTMAPAFARQLRERALAEGIVAAVSLPE